jgi:hypothetical protein
VSLPFVLAALAALAHRGALWQATRAREGVHRLKAGTLDELRGRTDLPAADLETQLAEIRHERSPELLALSAWASQRVARADRLRSLPAALRLVGAAGLPAAVWAVRPLGPPLSGTPLAAPAGRPGDSAPRQADAPAGAGVAPASEGTPAAGAESPTRPRVRRARRAPSPAPETPAHAATPAGAVTPPEAADGPGGTSGVGPAATPEPPPTPPEARASPPEAAATPEADASPPAEAATPEAAEPAPTP